MAFPIFREYFVGIRVCMVTFAKADLAQKTASLQREQAARVLEENLKKSCDHSGLAAVPLNTFLVMEGLTKTTWDHGLHLLRNSTGTSNSDTSHTKSDTSDIWIRCRF